MATSFNRLAYENLEVCNAVDMAEVEAMAVRTGLGPGARLLDIGTGNAGVAIRLARTLGLSVTAVELDPLMADLARDRIAAAGAGDQVRLVQGASAGVLAAGPPFDLITALGTTHPAGDGVREPCAVLSALAAGLTSSGWLIWGDVAWKGEPPVPLRQLMEMANTYADDAGWRAAATKAGLEVVAARMSTGAEWERYTTGMRGAADRWLADNPDAPEAAGVRRNADRVSMMFDFGRPWIDFGLYLFRKA